MFGISPRRRYAFCETVVAGPFTPLHIRQLTREGMLKSGGADTLSFCGTKVGWDTEEITLKKLPDLAAKQGPQFKICAACLEAALSA
ncbi:hypothetical protein [Leifsonia sp. Leaf264]|uniref:hypothetical protein n=1 Tax=Leifsonia sp. Leaf264 TaxID=1736314 RepID=UPI0006F68F6A|nr:hypothetical protein [Leifsonia sp. Leaf264]KQO98345.1 hypothetical protein ASF30_09805 [Leifsonia sp. Leaf264]